MVVITIQAQLLDGFPASSLAARVSLPFGIKAKRNFGKKKV